MWVDDAMNIIIKEFPFIKFKEREFLKPDPLMTNYFYIGDGCVINMGYEMIAVVILIDDKPYKVNMISNEDDIIKKLYEYLPKDFYLPYQRNDKINTIIDG